MNDDAISRQSVLAMLDDILDEVMDGEGYQYGKWSEYVEHLPSAQPTQTNADSTQNFGRDTNVPSTDCISRQAAIDALCNVFCGGHSDCKFYPKCDNLKPLQDLPAAQPDLSSYSDKLWRAAYERGKAEAQPQRMRGRWKRTYLDHVAIGERPSILYCSKCCQCIAYPTNFCPNCGADMRGEQDE